MAALSSNSLMRRCIPGTSLISGMTDDASPRQQQYAPTHEANEEMKAEAPSNLGSSTKHLRPIRGVSQSVSTADSQTLCNNSPTIKKHGPDYLQQDKDKLNPEEEEDVAQYLLCLNQPAKHQRPDSYKGHKPSLDFILNTSPSSTFPPSPITTDGATPPLWTSDPPGLDVKHSHKKPVLSSKDNIEYDIDIETNENEGLSNNMQQAFLLRPFHPRIIRNPQEISNKRHHSIQDPQDFTESPVLRNHALSFPSYAPPPTLAPRFYASAMLPPSIPLQSSSQPPNPRSTTPRPSSPLYYPPRYHPSWTHGPFLNDKNKSQAYQNTTAAYLGPIGGLLAYQGGIPQFFKGAISDCYDTQNFERTEQKIKRRRLTPQQLHLLETIFEKTCFPSAELRQQLGTHLGLSSRTIQIWFQNKRQSTRNKVRAAEQGAEPESQDNSTELATEYS